MATLKLKNGIKVNGKLRKELTYDFDKITADMYCKADAKSHASSDVNRNVMELDTAFQLYLGFMSIIAENPEIDLTDLERICGRDLVEVTRLGRLFITSASEDEVDETGSTEDQSEAQ